MSGRGGSGGDGGGRKGGARGGSGKDESARFGDELARLREEVARLHAALEAERRHAAQWRDVAEQRRVTLERFRQQPVVRMLVWLLGVARPPANRVAHTGRAGVRALKRSASAILAVPHRLSAPRRESALRERIAGLPAPPDDPRSVTLIVLTHDGRERLCRLLPALRGTVDREGCEILVFDNGSGEETRAFLEDQRDVSVLHSDVNLSFSAANNLAAEHAAGDVLVFLNDDVEPIAPGWLERMLAALAGEVVAVGAHLVYPRRPLLAAARTRDLGTQHRGIELVPVPGGVPRAVNVGAGEDPRVDGEPYEAAAVTAACVAVDRSAFEAVGGFDDRYDYGAEDVDLCWRLRSAGGRIAVAPGAVLFHHEGATRLRLADAATRNRRQERNWDLLAQRFGPEIARAVELDRLTGELALTSRPYEVAITVTRDLEEAGYGDWYTAHELGDALTSLGWKVRYVERYRDAWYDLSPEVDAVLALLDTFDVRRVARPGLTTIAWIRNRTDRWISTPWFDDFDLVLTTSGLSAETITERTRHRPELFPIATNPDRFSGEPESEDRSRVVFTGNYWGRDTRVDDLVAAVPDLEVYGLGWEEVAAVAPRWMGRRAYEDLPDLYREALVVVDQAAEHTRADASLNSRVFDALAAGALVVTNQSEGSRELFDDRLPTYETPQELAGLISQVRANPNAALRRVKELQDLVCDEHTYTARAMRLRGLLVERANRARFVLKTSAPSRSRAERWGDWHLAEAFARELRAAGHPTVLQTADDWEDRAGYAADVAIHLKGRSVAPRAEGQVHVVWNISHPEELTVEECDAADLVLVASRTFPDELRSRTNTPVEMLLQATDERRFRPLPPDPENAHDVAFVGNSRHAERPAVRDALAAGLRPAIYGGNWERFLPDPDVVVATFVPNEELARVYSSVKVLLNDHWEGMRAHGFVSNRVFDALACGACVVSDEHEELTALFGDAVATYRGPSDLRATVDALLGDPERRAEMGARGRALALEAHTFRHRAAELLSHLRPLLPANRLAALR